VARYDSDFAGPLLTAAVQVAKGISADVILAHAGALDNPGEFKALVHPPTRLVLICGDSTEEQRAQAASIECMAVPPFNLTRMGQIKVATLIAFSQRILKGGDVFVFLTGIDRRRIDTLVTLRVGEEYELFQSVGQPKLTEHIRRAVFEKVLTLVLELASEGREGKPIGSLFVIGDHRQVQKFSHPGRINPFRGYGEKARNILDDSIRETVKELAKLDGAFLLKGNGVIVSAGSTLRPPLAGEGLPPGLGARHAAAANITMSTRSIAISLSESTGTVRVWRRGALITEIERAGRVWSYGSGPTAIR
jgi:DNA integrity scanning protein DisA with diadenylate cyclase activity